MKVPPAIEGLVRLGPVAVKPLGKMLQNEKPAIRRSAAWALGRIGDKTVLSQLVETLDDDNAGVREEAARALGKLGDTGAVDALYTVLEDITPEVRHAAVLALGWLGDVGSIGLLLELLRTEDADIQDSVATALGQFKNVEAVFGAIVEKLRDQDESFGRSLSCTVVRLGALDSGASEAALDVLLMIGMPAIPDLILALEEGSGSARKLAKEALTRMQWPASVALARALAETGKGVRAKILEPIEENRLSRIITPPFEKYPGFRKRLLETLIEIGEPSVGPLSQIVRDSHFSIQISAAWALAEIGKPSVEALDQLLKTDDRSIRELASWSLSRIGNPSIDLLIDDLAEENFRIRDAARKALVKIGEPAVAPLITGIAGMSEDVQAEACGALVDIGVPSVRQLIKALDNESPVVRRLAARTLGDVSTTALAFIMRNIKVKLPPGVSKQVIEFVLNQLLPRMEKAVVEAAKKAAGAYLPEWILGPLINMAVQGLKPALLFVIRKFMPDLYQQLMNFILRVRVPAARPLAGLLKDSDERVRIEAATSLGKIGSPDAVQDLGACLLRDENPGVRAASAEALGKIADASGLDYLEDARKKEKNKKVQEYIVEAIRSIERRRKYSR